MADREKRSGTAEATARSSESAAASKEKAPSPRKTVGQMRLESLTFKKYPGQQQVDPLRVDHSVSVTTLTAKNEVLQRSGHTW